jgi:hypothetical protein
LPTNKTKKKYTFLKIVYLLKKVIENLISFLRLTKDKGQTVSRLSKLKSHKNYFIIEGQLFIFSLVSNYFLNLKNLLTIKLTFEIKSLAYFLPV